MLSYVWKTVCFMRVHDRAKNKIKNKKRHNYKALLQPVWKD